MPGPAFWRASGDPGGPGMTGTGVRSACLWLRAPHSPNTLLALGNNNVTARGARPLRASGTRNPGPPENTGRNSRGAPRRVRDATPVAVLGSGFDEGIFEFGDIDAGGVHRREFVLQVQAFLGQVEPMEWRGGGQARLHGLETTLDCFPRPLPSPLGTVLLERLEVAAHRSALVAPLGQGGLVPIAHGPPATRCLPSWCRLRRHKESCLMRWERRLPLWTDK